MREMAFIDVLTEPPTEETDEGLMTEDEFEREVEMASRGEWEALGLDPLPEGFTPATIEDLRNAG